MRNVLFISFIHYETIDVHDFYADLLRQFIENGDYVYVLSPIEKKYKTIKTIIYEKNCKIINAKIGNYFNVGKIEKGLTLVSVENIFKKYIKKYCNNRTIDLILYATPPVTLIKPISFIKKRDKAKTYLMLKDIFPQNALDIGILTNKGLFKALYKYFRYKEKKLYKISDRIGCMSQANVQYLLNNNEYIDATKVEVCPNCIDPIINKLEQNDKVAIRDNYKLPTTKKIFVYGGNIGKPQGVPFLLECIASQKDNDGIFFLIVGEGTEFNFIKNYIDVNLLNNVMLLNKLPKNEYEHLAAACDYGLIFLDNRFTIPNFPSRLLSYMQVGLPIIACTDMASDVGKTIVEGGFGWWCQSNDVTGFCNIINKLNEYNYTHMQEKEIQFLIDNYSASKVYKIINKFLLEK